MPDASSVASDTMDFPKQNVIDVLKDIADLAATNGTSLYFDVNYKNKDALEFRTYVNQPGVDTTTGGMRDTMFGDLYGNIANAELEEDYSDEYNVVTAWGAGPKGNQEYSTVEDTTLSGRSRWARREVAINAGNVDSTALVAIAKAELRYGRPRLTFTCDLLDTYSNAVYGAHWYVGDKIKVSFNGRTYTGIVPTADITYSALTSYQKEEETINASFVYEGMAA
jgi:hypothetical protein